MMASPILIIIINDNDDDGKSMKTSKSHDPHQPPVDA